MQENTPYQAWLNFKSSLKENSEWLAAFDESAVAQAIKIIKSKPRNYYEPLLLESMLKEASAALDRCLAFRRDAYDLEIAAVKAAAEYQLFLNLSEKEYLLDLNALSVPRLKVELAGYKQASSLYSSDDKGFAKHDETLSDSSDADIGIAADREKLLKERLEIRKKFEADYHLRHITPGNAHNFVERLERTVPLLADDLQEAYEKLFATQIGIKAIYNVDIPIPKLQGEGIVDELVIWARDAIRFLEIESSKESNYNLVLPLIQKWVYPEKPIMDPGDFRRSSQQEGFERTFIFDLDKDVFFNQEHVRLRSVGLSLGASPPTNDPGTYISSKAYWRLRATIHTPRQPNLMDPGKFYYRPPVVLGDVAVFGHMVPVAMSAGTECRNVNPQGKWKIVVGKFGVWANDRTAQAFGETWWNNPNFVLDLKLHLNIIAKPLPDKDSVFGP